MTAALLSLWRGIACECLGSLHYRSSRSMGPSTKQARGRHLSRLQALDRTERPFEELQRASLRNGAEGWGVGG